MPKPPRGFAVRPYEGAHASGESTRAADGAEGSREGERSGQGHGEVFARGGRFHLNAAVAEVQPAPLPTVKGRRWKSEILELRGFPAPTPSKLASVTCWVGAADAWLQLMTAVVC